MRAVLELLRADFGLDPSRGGMVRALADHVGARLELLGIDEPAYVARVRGDDQQERDRLIHVATVRHSWFYRDATQLEELAERMVERHAKIRADGSERPLELWVAGCAGGEEAWTLAMMSAELGLSIRLLATDVDAYVVHDAELGCYGAWSLRDLPERLRRFVTPTEGDRWRVVDELRDRVEFAVHNLCDPTPARRFDVISCRNVLIYFEPVRAHAVVTRLRESLAPDGELLLGAGDLLFRVGDESIEQRPRRSPAADKARILTPPRAVATTPPRPVQTPAPARQSPAPEERPAPVEQLADAERKELRHAGEAVGAGDYGPALEQLETLIQADPLLAEAHLWAGIAHYGLRQDQAAAESLRRARCLEPQLWPATLFAALTNERRGRWQAANRCWVELERTIRALDAPRIEGTEALLDALPDWRGEALALARQRISKHAE